MLNDFVQNFYDQMRISIGEAEDWLLAHPHVKVQIIGDERGFIASRSCIDPATGNECEESATGFHETLLGALGGLHEGGRMTKQRNAQRLAEAGDHRGAQFEIEAKIAERRVDDRPGVLRDTQLAAAFCRRIEALREQSNGTGQIVCTWNDQGVTALCSNGIMMACTSKPEASIRGAIEAALAGMSEVGF